MSVSTTDHFLEVSSITKSYDEHQKVLDDINLQIRQGELVSLLGPSGSGKTTLLMLIAGFQKPSSGEIMLNGRSVARLPPHARNIGVVFQNYALFPHMTVEENLYFPLRMRKISRSVGRTKIERALETVGLSQLAGRYPHQLSGGQQQRVALARTLVYEPSLILLDEPLGALDKHLREQMQIEFKRIHRELATTMIYVTHDQSEAMTMSDRIAVMNLGAIEQIGTPADVYYRPQTEFVASFIGDSNILRGTVEKDGTVNIPGLGHVTCNLNGRSVGDNLSLLLRPESLTLRSRSERTQSAGWNVELKEVVNYGDSNLVFVAAGRRDLRIRVPAREWNALQGQHAFSVEWLPEHVHVIGRPTPAY
jgi:putative spermidine/putrescine transport system ATP-binding protein